MHWLKELIFYMLKILMKYIVIKKILKILTKYIVNNENISFIFLIYKKVFFIVYWAADHILTLMSKLLKNRGHKKETFVIFKTCNKMPVKFNTISFTKQIWVLQWEISKKTEKNLQFWYKKHKKP